VKLALAGDTMLGRGVAAALESRAPESLVAPEVVAVAREADLFVVNLECCISERGEPWPDPGKPFFFRAPPRATELLAHLGVDCVTLANNHALDFGETALLDTLGHLAAAGITYVGAGADVAEARAPAVLEAGGLRLGVVAATDHPEAYAAGADRPGVAFADLRRGTAPDWLQESVSAVAAHADAVLATVHWGPNMVAAPVPHVRAAAETLRDAGAALVAGHSAHVFHGAGERVLYDLGDFLDDYAVDRRLRNDLGLFFLVTFDADGPVRVEAVPLALDFCHTRLAEGDDRVWVRDRFRAACAALGTEVAERGGRLIVDWG
jgi:poly-gamma-glutamate capsule biosynthesis protein CapA/YwtB (metallophosphatase superfamily)